MYFLALATDYDGTLATDGAVDRKTLAALERLKETGRKLLLVTGRELPDLKRVFPDMKVFDKVVAENGALLYTPATEEEATIAPAPPAVFVERLTQRGVEPISVGASIVATWEPHQIAVLETIRELGLELEIIFNKGAVMVLPSGVNKATGLAAALSELELSAHNVVGIGDAENDHAFLRACGCGAAVANALPMVKETADFVTEGAGGAGVIELIDALIARDGDIAPIDRHCINVGVDGNDERVQLWPNRGSVLIAGSSGIGKSTLATALSERFVEQGFQFCVFDPEGDYQELEGAVSLGDAKTPPTIDAAMTLLRKPDNNLVVNTLGLGMPERPPFFAKLFPEIAAMRAKTGRPHWLIIDEAHHLLPAARDGTSLALPQELPAAILITVHPEMVSPDALAAVDTVLALGPKAREVVANFCATIGRKAPKKLPKPKDEQVLLWRRKPKGAARLVTATKPRQAHKRHTRKYAEGNLDEENSFYFRGPDDALNLRAHNLQIFLQMADGVDDDTWEHHLRRGDYSAWFRDMIKDDELAEEAAGIETDKKLRPAKSRAKIKGAVERRYTAPASEK